MRLLKLPKNILSTKYLALQKKNVVRFLNGGATTWVHLQWGESIITDGGGGSLHFWFFLFFSKRHAPRAGDSRPLGRQMLPPVFVLSADVTGTESTY